MVESRMGGESYGFRKRRTQERLVSQTHHSTSKVKSVGLENNEGHKNKRDFFHIENVIAARSRQQKKS